MYSRLNRVVLTTVLVLSASTGLAGPAQAAASGKGDGTPARTVGIESLPAADQARQRAQEPLLKLNDRIYDLTSGVYERQFAGTRVDLQNNALELYWAGKVPPALSRLRAEAAKTGVALSIKAAKFSRRELMAAADQVLPAASLPGTVEIAVDGSGLTVAAGDLPAVANGARTASPAEAALAQRIADISSRTGMAITITAARPGTPSFDDTRDADSSPYWAGAQIIQGGGGCTSGFGMYASGSTSTRFTLTAAHCANFTDGRTFTNGAGDAMGQSDFIRELYDRADAYDLGVVRLNAGQSNAPYIYITNNSADGGIAVAGYASGGIPAGGNYCVHGMTAVNCNLLSGGTIRQCTGWPPAGRCVYTIAMNALNTNGMTWCRGDSGGPIYYWTGSTVIAAGVVSWSNHELGNCSRTGGASVVATAVNLIPGLRVRTTSAP